VPHPINSKADGALFKIIHFWEFTPRRTHVNEAAYPICSVQFCTDELPSRLLYFAISGSDNSGVGDREMRVLPPVG
jgi:hypothetical protein